MGDKVEAKIKKVKSYERYLGVICAFFSIAQAGFYIFLPIMGILTYNKNQERQNTLALSFEGVYLSTAMQGCSPSCILKPKIFLIMCYMYIVLAGMWLCVSLFLLRAYKRWLYISEVKRASKAWFYMTLSVCIVDFILFATFLFDYLCIHQHYSEKFRFTRYSPITGSPTKKSKLSAEARNKYNDEISQLHKVIHKMKQEKDYVPLMHYPFKNKTVEERINPFVHTDPWQFLSLAMRRNKTFKRGDIILRGEDYLPNGTYVVRMNREGTHNIRSTTDKWGDKTVGEYDPHLPSFLIMLIVMKGFVTWCFNIASLVYFCHNIRKMVVSEVTVNYWTDLFDKWKNKKRIRVRVRIV